MFQSHVIPKLFLGYLLTNEIKMFLSQSHLWKEEKLLQPLPLIEQHFQARDYIGNFVESFQTYVQLKQKLNEIDGYLQRYCPQLILEKQKSVLFSELFIS